MLGQCDTTHVKSSKIYAHVKTLSRLLARRLSGQVFVCVCGGGGGTLSYDLQSFYDPRSRKKFYLEPHNRRG